MMLRLPDSFKKSYDFWVRVDRPVGTPAPCFQSINGGTGGRKIRLSSYKSALSRAMDCVMRLSAEAPGEPITVQICEYTENMYTRHLESETTFFRVTPLHLDDRKSKF